MAGLKSRITKLKSKVVKGNKVPKGLKELSVTVNGYKGDIQELLKLILSWLEGIKRLSEITAKIALKADRPHFDHDALVLKVGMVIKTLIRKVEFISELKNACKRLEADGVKRLRLQKRYEDCVKKGDAETIAKLQEELEITNLSYEREHFELQRKHEFLIREANGVGGIGVAARELEAFDHFQNEYYANSAKMHSNYDSETPGNSVEFSNIWEDFSQKMQTWLIEDGSKSTKQLNRTIRSSGESSTESEEPEGIPAFVRPVEQEDKETRLLPFNEESLLNDSDSSSDIPNSPNYCSSDSPMMVTVKSSWKDIISEYEDYCSEDSYRMGCKNASRYFTDSSSQESTSPLKPKSSRVPKLPPRPNTILKAKVIFEYQAEEETDVSAFLGDCLEILKKNNTGWWDVKNTRTGRSGSFPSNYCEIVEDSNFSSEITAAI